jgi:hypoxanthine phosphoribosyltransferase
MESRNVSIGGGRMISLQDEILKLLRDTKIDKYMQHNERITTKEARDFLQQYDNTLNDFLSNDGSVKSAKIILGNIGSVIKFVDIEQRLQEEYKAAFWKENTNNLKERLGVIEDYRSELVETNVQFLKFIECAIDYSIEKSFSHISPIREEVNYLSSLVFNYIFDGLNRFLKEKQVKHTGVSLILDYFAYAREISQNYDLGIAIAEGGYTTSYPFVKMGLPVMDVNMKKIGRGASWKPKSNYDSGNIPGKKVLILEDDIVTGKTLKRACREISKFNPAEIAVCLSLQSLDMISPYFSTACVLNNIQLYSFMDAPPLFDEEMSKEMRHVIKDLGLPPLWADEVEE